MHRSDVPPFFVPLIMLVQLVGIVKAEKRLWQAQGLISQCTVRAERVVMPSPYLDQHLGFLQRIKDVTVQ